jgi:uncharacterized protein with ATP-grasp and redox domains
VDESKIDEVIREGCRILAEDFSQDKCSIEVSTKVHSKILEVLGTNDPYVDIKNRCNTVAQKLVPKAEQYIDRADDKLHAAIICAIAGNVLDFGIEGSAENPEVLEQAFDKLCEEGLHVDYMDKIREYFKPDAKILFFTDNCGEIIFDKLLLREIKKLGVHITLVVKGAPILNDATMDDVEAFGMEAEVDEVMTTNAFAVGLDFNKITPELQNKIETIDIIISKGMGNFEAFSETDYKPIAYLLRTKCPPVANALGLELNMNVAKLVA